MLLLEHAECACAGDGLELRVGSERPQDRADVVARRLVRDVKRVGYLFDGAAFGEQA